MCRYTKKVDWLEMWDADKKSIIDTMIKNMNADINAGYNPIDACIIRQKAVIDEYISSYKFQLIQFASMTDDETNRWCFFDLKARGAIE